MTRCGWCVDGEVGVILSKGPNVSREVCVCARNVFFYTLITPECDTPESRVCGCTLNENHKFYSLDYFIYKPSRLLKKFNFQLKISR
jgi:hypothetical protein